jgi:hexokinase
MNVSLAYLLASDASLPLRCTEAFLSSAFTARVSVGEHRRIESTSRRVHLHSSRLAAMSSDSLCISNDNDAEVGVSSEAPLTLYGS